MTSSQLRETRKVTITTPHSEYNDDLIKRDIGAEYKVVFWHAPETNLDLNDVHVQLDVDGARFAQDLGSRATVVWFTTKKIEKVDIVVSYQV